MAITPLPTPPSRQDPANFAVRADAFLGALPDFAEEANAQAAEVEADAVSAEASRANALISANSAAGNATSASNSATSATNSAASAVASATTATQQAALATASVANGAKPYATYAAALADLANIATGQIVDVVTDETRSSQRSLYQDNGTTLVYLRAVEMYTSPVPYIPNQPINDVLTMLLVRAGLIPQDNPTLFADLGSDAYFA